ncbi:plasmid replication protein RepC [Methylocystis sp. ATCC 49242]|uniref:plasmid replication protein RepC n=1 Tax=Methylocystis sp. ATCC 49242 TaxID=622637 RepID=UPI00055EBBE0
MMQTQPTTPFGRRSLTLAMVASQAAMKDFAERPGAAQTVVHKWRLFRALTEAKGPLGVTDRALSVLHALLSFHQETALSLPAAAGEERAGLVVFPSNRELSIRAHGMAPATLRRHLASLVEAGLIIRRDSPNGKRYARKGQGGEIENAFGFDLTPLVARADEIENLAEEARAESRAMALLREKITLARRDIVKMIETGVGEGVPGDWRGAQDGYLRLAARYARNLTRRDLEALAGDLAGFAAQLRKLLEDHVNGRKKSASESHSERHIQNQITDSRDSEPSLREGGPEPSGPTGRRSPPPVAPEPPSAGALNPGGGGAAKTYPLGMVLSACPDILDYARGGEIANWRDLAAAAAVARPALGVSPDAWSQALETMGEHDAAIVIAAILQRSEEIRSAGGYLRALTAKAQAGEFSLGPLLMALLRAKTPRKQKAAG